MTRPICCSLTFFPRSAQGISIGMQRHTPVCYRPVRGRFLGSRQVAEPNEGLYGGESQEEGSTSVNQRIVVCKQYDTLP
jgi:hypothetical protein